MNPMQILLNQLKARNPQMFQFIEKAQKNQSNPEEIFKQVTKDYKPEQLDNLFKTAKQFGVPDEVINKLK